MEGFDPQVLMNMMKGKGGGDPMQMVYMFAKMNNVEMFETAVKNVDMLLHGADILTFSISGGHDKIVENLIKTHHVDLTAPPERVVAVPDYRRASYTIQAIQSGNQMILDMVLSNGGSLTDSGCVCLSKKRKNIVISNAIGAAAYHGQDKILKRLIKMTKDQQMVEMASVE